MTDTYRAAVSRRNARRSTGPRTERGKSRVARNALRHGLSVSVQKLPEFDATVAALAQLIAGEGADQVRLDHARRIAEAQIDLQRVRSARRKLMEKPIVERNGDRELTAAYNRRSCSI